VTRRVLRSEIVDYQTYEEGREAVRAAILEQKVPRRVHVGDYLTFLFENHDTIRYQIQEMMRAERIVKEADILHEIETYNEVLGGEGELGATLLIEVETPQERALLLRQWLDLPKALYARLADGTKIRPTYDERQVGEERVSSVQYLKFPLGGKVPVALGADHPALTAETLLDEEQRAALGRDIAG
jgi:hypothetical protein